MAMRLTIHEICPKCARVDARQNGDGTVHTIVHGCVVKGQPPRSYLPGEVIFVPANESDNIADLVLAYRELQAKNKRLSSDLGEMAKDCAMLQKVLLDIGFVVRDTLGIEIGSKLSPRAALAPGSWKCTCDMWNYPSRDSCTNCERKNE